MTRIIFTWIFITTIALSCNTAKDKYQLQVFNTSKDKWGYAILYNNKTIIFQEHIPCISGNTAFSSEKDAKALGTLVIDKLEKGQLPTVVLSDLKALDIQLN